MSEDVEALHECNVKTLTTPDQPIFRCVALGMVEPELDGLPRRT